MSALERRDIKTGFMGRLKKILATLTPQQPGIRLGTSLLTCAENKRANLHSTGFQGQIVCPRGQLMTLFHSCAKFWSWPLSAWGYRLYKIATLSQQRLLHSWVDLAELCF